MTLLGLSLAQLASIFGALAGGVTLLYILKLRRRRVRVPFAQLWERVLKEKESTSLFRRLKRILSLLLQLLFLLLLVLALGDPRLSSEVLEGRHIILLVDTSASMRAIDGGGGTRMHAATRQAREIIRGMNGSDLLMLVRMDAQLTPLSRFESDEKVLLRVLEELQVSDTRADLSRALRFCADALRRRKNPLLIIIGDGAYPADALSAAILDQRSGGLLATDRKGEGGKAEGKGGAVSSAGATPTLEQADLRGVAVRYISVGESGDNVGIVAFNARRYAQNRTSFEMFLEIMNYRDKVAEADLQIYADDELIEVRRLKLEPRERARYTCEPELDGKRQKSWCAMAASGELLMARLVPPGASQQRPPALDKFPTDDKAYAVLPRLKKQRVLLVTRGNLYLEGVLLLNENLELSKVTPEEYTAARALKADALILDGFWPESAPARPYLLLNPPKGTSGPFSSAGKLRAPLITDQDHRHPVMRWVTLKHVNIADTIKFKRGPRIKALAASFRAPVIAAYESGPQRAVAIGFDITRSDLPLRVAFPLLMINSLQWFMGEGESLITSYKTGQHWSVPLPGLGESPGRLAARITEPDGRSYQARCERGRVELYGNQVGPYAIAVAQGEHRIAANLADPQESDITPRSKLILGRRELSGPGGFGIALRREIWIYLLLAAFGLALVEWLTYNRRITV